MELQFQRQRAFEEKNTEKEDEQDDVDISLILKKFKDCDRIPPSGDKQSIKDIEFLMKNKSSIFNITPPNAKAGRNESIAKRFTWDFNSDDKVTKMN